MFFFVIGTRRRSTDLGIYQLACRNGHVAAHRIVKLTRWFTIFFIPVIPMSRRYVSICAACGAQLQIPKDAAEEMMAKYSGIDAANPVDPVAPPLPSGGSAAEPAAPAPGAGWYPDPGGAGGLRWWDGSAWTETTHQG